MPELCLLYRLLQVMYRPDDASAAINGTVAKVEPGPEPDQPTYLVALPGGWVGWKVWCVGGRMCGWEVGGWRESGGVRVWGTLVWKGQLMQRLYSQ